MNLHNTGGNYCLSARGRATVVTARLKGKIHHATSSLPASLLQGNYLSVVQTRGMSIPLPHNLTIPNYYRANRRVRTNLPQG
jgi:hypothetical protein